MGITEYQINYSIPHTEVVNVAGSGSTSSTTNVDVPQAVSISNFQKLLPETKLVITISGGTFIDDVFSNVNIAVDIGGTDTDVARADSFTSNADLGFSGTVAINGLAAGTIPTIKVQWRVTAGTVVATMTSKWSLIVTETM